MTLVHALSARRMSSAHLSVTPEVDGSLASVGRLPDHLASIRGTLDRFEPLLLELVITKR